MRANNYPLWLNRAIFCIAFFAAACGNSPASNESVVTKELLFDKFIGTWQIPAVNGFERWTKKDDGSFITIGFSIKGNDTSWNENGRVYPEAGIWVFENTVKGQNDEKAIKFIASIFTDSMVQFSNPAHDFPTDINYSFVDNNRIHAFIFGPNDKGGKDTIHFEFKRVK
ncbi:MAG: hypothetical protein E6H09_21020 [Bacteroidetes bacterium]|jgi:hypothetical protein|nr:MAG: hypothetical protein E6H09_21020 [Bacteroidota bacterium]